MGEHIGAGRVDLQELDYETDRIQAYGLEPTNCAGAPVAVGPSGAASDEISVSVGFGDMYLYGREEALSSLAEVLRAVAAGQCAEFIDKGRFWDRSHTLVFPGTDISDYKFSQLEHDPDEDPLPEGSVNWSAW